MTTGYGVEWVRADGTTYVGQECDLAGARQVVAECRGRGWVPQASRVVRQERGPWLPVDDTQEGATE